MTAQPRKVFINQIPPEAVVFQKDFLQPALDANDNTMTMEDVERFAHDGELFVGGIYIDREQVAAFVLEKVIYPRKRALRIVLLGGERMSEWMEDFTQYIDDLKEQGGINFAELIGRPGWTKVLKQRGYTAQVVFRR